MVVTSTTEMVVTAFGSVLHEVQLVSKIRKPLKCTVLDIAEDLSENHLFIYNDNHPPHPSQKS